MTKWTKKRRNGRKSGEMDTLTPETIVENALYTVDEAASLLKTCRQTIYNLIQRNELKHYKCSKRGFIRFRGSHLNEFLEKRLVFEVNSRLNNTKTGSSQAKKETLGSACQQKICKN